MIASTNMNVAILILFWSLLGWKFAFAEFFGGVIIIAVVTAGLTLLFDPQSSPGCARSIPRHKPPRSRRWTTIAATTTTRRLKRVLRRWGRSSLLRLREICQAATLAVSPTLRRCAPNC